MCSSNFVHEPISYQLIAAENHLGYLLHFQFEFEIKVTMYYSIKFFAGNFDALHLRNYNRY